jgi:hypothetical protein
MYLLGGIDDSAAERDYTPAKYYAGFQATASTIW